VDYRYQPGARAPIDTGEWWQVMEIEGVIATYFLKNLKNHRF
jgi:hypothetical protein